MQTFPMWHEVGCSVLFSFNFSIFNAFFQIFIRQQNMFLMEDLN